MSSATLGRAEEAINAMDTWSSAVDVIKQVMDAVGPIAAVCLVSFCLPLSELIPVLQLQPYANLAWSLISKIPEVRLLTLSGYTGHSFCFCLAVRLCYYRFSVTTMSEHYFRRYEMRSNSQKMPML
jgi:hypothetical protein